MSAGRWPDDPGRWSPEQLREHARAEGDDVDGDRDDYEWTYEPRFSLAGLAGNSGRLATPEEWAAWLADERAVLEADGCRPRGYYERMEAWHARDPSDLPIVVFERRDGTFQIAGWHHRVAIAHKLGWSSAPAVVGHRRIG